ncbi:ABC transporter ATP-binding protein [Paenibacillus sp. MMS18-CY102]|uniref:ABC transporter ATP-binding protein n=1 Tax=Paenibacillus sp. MMS18-CY102 TaxID=2682849 RepID=UPI001365D114|nr:ABC transporter ATP-binding protein [Paenibacillus sp. MMS18-CY102]MWC30686.1 ATP-binding cassette domain-containing protein [Paenibacillus sp. MMS18-CY102]
MSVLLQATALSQTFGSTNAVKQVDLSIHEGRCIALLGPNGAGKTTTIRMLTGLLKPTHGTIEFHGVKAGEDMRKHIGYLPQAPSYYGWMSGEELLVYAGQLCGLSGRSAKAHAAELLQRVGLSDAARRRVGGYSGGMKQRLGIAQALMHRPRLLILDEPVSALDPIGRRDVLSLMAELKEETTILFSTHVLHDAETICDDVVIMEAGRVAIAGSVEGLRAEHRQSVIELRIEEEDERSVHWLNGVLAGSRTIAKDASVFMQEGALVIQGSNLDELRQAVIHIIAEEGIKVSQMKAGYSSLEDLFMKAVGAVGSLDRPIP